MHDVARCRILKQPLPGFPQAAFLPCYVPAEKQEPRTTSQGNLLRWDSDERLQPAPQLQVVERSPAAACLTLIPDEGKQQQEPQPHQARQQLAPPPSTPAPEDKPSTAPTTLVPVTDSAAAAAPPATAAEAMIVLLSKALSERTMAFTDLHQQMATAQYALEAAADATKRYEEAVVASERRIAALQRQLANRHGVIAELARYRQNVSEAMFHLHMKVVDQERNADGLQRMADNYKRASE